MSTATTEHPHIEEEPELKRVMGPKLLLLFIVGDILGAGVYAVTGEMAVEVGGIVWLPFLVAFVVATLTALSYLELVTKYPQAAGAALYTHKAFGIHFVTFLVAFAVICSGITSASTSSNLLAVNLLAGLDAIGIVGLGRHGHRRCSWRSAFMVLLAADQPARRRREREVQRRAHAGRDRGAGHRHRRRLLRDGAGRRRPRPGRGLRLRQRRGHVRSPSPWPPRSRSSRWSASRTPSTWSRRPRSPSGSSRG